MTDSLRSYVRWEGELRTGRPLGTIVRAELRRIRTNSWAILAAGGGLAWALASTIQLYQFRDAGDAVHAMAGFTAMLDQLRWFILATAAVLGTPALLEDARLGALELYLSRPLTRWTHLLGKALAVTVVCLAIYAIAIAAYTLAAYALFDEQPDGWTYAPLTGFLYGALWSMLASGAALAVSCLTRNARAAAAGFFGGAVALHLATADVLPRLTDNDAVSILSPFKAHEAIQSWLFQGIEPLAFPPWWGLTEILALAAVAWIIVALRHPRLPGADDA